MSKRFLNNSSLWLQIPFIINIAIGVITLPILLSSLGDKEYGIFILLFDIFGMVSIFVRSVNTNFIRNISRYKKEIIYKHYLSDYTFLLILVFLLSFVLVLLSTFFYELRFSYFILFISFFIGLFASFWNLYNYAKLNYKKYFFVDISFSILNVIFTLVLWKLNYLNFDTLVYINFISNGVKLLFSYLQVNHLLCITLIDLKFRIIKRELNSLTSFLIISIGTYLIFNVDSIVTGIVLDTSMITFLVIHLKIPRIVMQMFYTFQDSKLPFYTSILRDKKSDELYRIIKKHFVINIIFVVSTVIVLYFISHYVYYIWLGNSFKYDDSFYIICLLVISVYSVTHYMGMIANVFKQEHITSKFIIIEGILNVILSVVFAKFYGIYGIVLGTLISHLLVMVSVVTILFIKNLNYLRSELC